MAKVKESYYLISREDVDRMDVSHLLDMLRYDGAKVECNPPDGYYLFKTQNFSGPCVERWKSFGIRVAAVGKDRREALIGAGLPY
jgi:hypothetical protein